MVASTRSVFDRQLETLQSDVLRLAEMVESQLMQAFKALQTRDVGLAWRVDTYDASVNRMRYSVEEQAYTLLALQQPNARDMRRIVAAVSIVTNLERMGDHAAGIARLVLSMNNIQANVTISEFSQMNELIIANFHDAIQAMRSDNHILAHDVMLRDEQIDDLHKQVYLKLINIMSDDPGMIEYATKLLWVSHNLERYSDRIGNICERVSYMITGILHEQRADEMP